MKKSAIHMYTPYLENIVNESSFAATKKARENGDGNLFRFHDRAQQGRKMTLLWSKIF